MFHNCKVSIKLYWIPRRFYDPKKVDEGVVSETFSSAGK